MFTLTLPNLAAVALALVQLLLIWSICWGRPQLLASKLRPVQKFVLFVGTLAGFMILLDYSEWKEGYATRGQERRCLSIEAYREFTEEKLAESHVTDCADLLTQTQQRFLQLSEELVRWKGTPLASIPLQDLGPGDACQRLQVYVWLSSIAALQAELEHDYSRGVGSYFRDRLFDGD